MKLRRWILGGLAIATLAAAGGGGGYYATQRVPAFYRQAVDVSPERLQSASDKLLENAAALASQARQQGKWQAVFTTEQINGWLAVDFLENHAGALPPGVSEPRVLLRPRGAVLAWQYRRGSIDTVVSVDVDLYLHEPNVIGLRLHSVRAGAMPMPLARLLDGVNEAAAKSNLQVQWLKSQGEPLALVTLPPIHGEQEKLLRLESLVLRDGELYVAGHTATAPADTAREARGSVWGAIVQAFVNANLQQ